MQRVILTAAFAAALALAVIWSQGGLDGIARWATEGQRAVQNAMAGALRSLRAGEPGALATLMGITFAYGFLHAVGPGHGKILIGGYGAGSDVRAGRLAGIALAASLAQATTAVGLVYAGVLVLGWSRDRLVAAGDDVLTPASYAAIGLVGVYLAVRGLRNVVRQWRPATQAHGAGCGCEGHGHGPSAAQVSKLRGWRDAALLVGSIAIRPCTGALFLLILTWRMGIEAAGIAGAYAMGLGTASVTVAVALLAVSARDGALVWTGPFARARAVLPALELVAGGVVALVSWQILVQWV